MMRGWLAAWKCFLRGGTSHSSDNRCNIQRLTLLQDGARCHERSPGKPPLGNEHTAARRDPYDSLLVVLVLLVAAAAATATTCLRPVPWQQRQ